MIHSILRSPGPRSLEEVVLPRGGACKPRDSTELCGTRVEVAVPTTVISSP